MRIYRIESRVDGWLGLYSHEGLEEVMKDLDICDEDCEAGGLHPRPSRDPALRHNTVGYDLDEWYFGFASMAQLRLWLFDPRFYLGLAKLDKVLRVYEMSDCDARVGDRQALFLRERSRAVEECELTAIPPDIEEPVKF